MTYVLHTGDCRAILPTLDDNSVDAVVTDPPYELTANKRGGSGEASLNLNSPAGRSRITTGFMGKAWDGTGIAYDVDMWREVLRVLKPGGYLLSFGGARTYHRMACAIEDAGFVIHPLMAWVFGSGFPKATSLSKAFDREAGAEREVVGQTQHPDGRPRNVVERNTGGYLDGQRLNGVGLPITAPATDFAKQWDGWYYGRQSLKPALEPICMAQKPPDTSSWFVELTPEVLANWESCRGGHDE